MLRILYSTAKRKSAVIAALASLVALAAIACEQTAPAPGTPDIIATARAGVNATLDAIAKANRLAASEQAHDSPEPLPETASPATLEPLSHALVSTPGPIAQPSPIASKLPFSGLSDPDAIVRLAPQTAQLVGESFTDTAFGSSIRRVSNASDRGGFETQIYSQLQAFSSDNKYLLLDGSRSFIVKRVDDLSEVAGLETSGWNAPRWHPIDSHTLVHFDSNDDTVLRLQFTNVDALRTQTVYTFPPKYERIRVATSWDELSEDGQWLAGMLTRNDGESVIFALDIESKRLGAQLVIPDLFSGPCTPDPIWGVLEPDWVGVSPLGNYLVVQWVRDGIARCSGLETFDLETGVFAGRVYDGHQHGDLGVLPDGVTEFFMTFELYHPSGDLSLGVRELPGKPTVAEPEYVQVLDWGNGDHISCRGPRGVCLVTAGQDAANGWGAFEGELFLQYTDGSVSRLGHHRSSSCGYWVQPRASISRDGSYAVFASDWSQETGGSNGCSGADDLGRGDPYIIDINAGRTPRR